MQTSHQLDATFSALADPTRRAILARLATGETSVKELCAPFEMSQPAISKHLKVLERAGLIARGREAQWRPARLDAGPLRSAADWLDEYRRFWEQSFDRLDEYLKRVQREDNDRSTADNVKTRLATATRKENTPRRVKQKTTAGTRNRKR